MPQEDKIPLSTILLLERVKLPNTGLICRYQIMRKCWQTDASERPSFMQLHNIFEELLNDRADAYNYVIASSD